ncbi:hypothetical protein BGW36DRAFT_361733 [Talaromyces proteolyticus]|uniref:Uncharacterized protein n=1 Tax=Talaromyces proteolyticus TaxID=1131652 RepID=A0AAD4PVV0_9EURO|nr:uncharacterized protein BGW36DRAFT_361733 [Talaromyces proteolyticus]KAH8693907.1 hypothetical protein BGW36DRAFT_361733 [Talaromyces proteolyticus]
MGVTLPNEVWMLIADFLPRMPDEPRWQPWIRYRRVNRMFKTAIEKHYIKHYLERTSLQLDCGSSEFQLNEEYSFGRFADEPHNRKAVLVSNGIIHQKPTSTFSQRQDQIDKLRLKFCERGYHPFMVMFVENGVTDMLPMDLEFGSIESTVPERSGEYDRICVFDWRTYFCTLFDELHRIDRARESGVSNQIQLAYELSRRFPFNTQTRAEVVLAAGTPNVGRDGRLLQIRRRRRTRLGFLSDQIEWRHVQPSLVFKERFAKLDEEYLARKLLEIQHKRVKQGRPIEW